MALDTVSSFNKYISPEMPACPVLLIQREVLSGVIQLCQDTHILTYDFQDDISAEAITSTTMDSIDIDLSSDSSVFTDMRPITIIQANINGRWYRPEAMNLLTDIADSIWNAGVEKEDILYFSFPADTSLDLIRLHNMSDWADPDDSTAIDSTTYLFLELVVKPYRSVTSVDKIFLEDYLETIVAYAKWKLQSMPGTEWYNPQAAEANRILWRRGRSRIKMTVLKKRTKNPTYVEPQEFGMIDWNI